MHSVSFRRMKLKTLNDKFTILLNELLNILSVANFMYEPEIEKLPEKIKSILNKENKDEQKMVEEIKKDIKKGEYKIKKVEIPDIESRELRATIDTIISLIERVNYGIHYISLYEKNSKSSYLEELTLFSFLEEEEIKNILSNINILSKLLKFRRENAQQIYIPSSLLHRRYRLYNTQKYMNDLILEKINSFMEKNKKIFIKEVEKVYFLLTSDYDIGENVDVKDTLNISLIKGSFFWRELVKFQPIIYHELGHTLFHLLKKNIKKDYEQLIEAMFFQMKPESYFSLEDLKKLKDEIFSDTVATYLAGDAYILSMFVYGLIGMGFYTNFSTEKNNNDYRIFKYKLTPIGVDFSIRREKHLLRLYYLLNLREKLKSKLKDRFYLIDENFEREIKKYISDIFPIFGYTGETWLNLSPEDKDYLLDVSFEIRYFSNEFLDFFTKKLSFSNIEQKHKIYMPLDKNNDENDDKNNKVKEFIIDIIDNKYIVSLFEEQKEKKDYDIEIKSFKKNKDETSNYQETDIYNLIWDVSLHRLNNIETLEGESLYDGRTSIVFHLLTDKRYSEIINYFVNNEKSLRLTLGRIRFIKGRGFFKENHSLKEKLEETKNLLSQNNRTEYKLKYLMGPHDTVYIERKDHTKKLEDNIFYFLYKFKAFADTHFVLFIEKDKIDKQNQEKINNSLEEIFYEKIYAFSLGWEDVILKEEGIDNIFLTKETLQHNKENLGIKRTETIISFLTEEEEFESFILTKLIGKGNSSNGQKIHTENSSEQKKSKYAMFLNVRTKNYKRIKNGQEKFLEIFLKKYEDKEFKAFQYPGRYDIVGYNICLYSSEDIKKFLTKIIETKTEEICPKFLEGIDDKIIIEDLVIDICRKI